MSIVTFSVPAQVDKVVEDGTSTVTIQLPASCPGGETGGIPPPPPPPPPPPVPPQPVGLQAINDTAGGLHINITWQSLPEAQGWHLQRAPSTAPTAWVDLPMTGLTPQFQDFTVVDTLIYLYRVAARNLAGDGPWSATVTVTANAGSPAPPPPAVSVMEFESPKNLRCKPFATGTTTPDDRLTWDRCPLASTYYIYVDETKIGQVNDPTNTFNVPATSSATRKGGMYGVSAIIQDPQLGAIETRISTQVSVQGVRPTFDVGSANTVPVNVTVTAQWQPSSGGGAARAQNLVRWDGLGNNGYMWNVYRDTVLVAECLWQMYYIDDNVAGGSSHSYQVSRVFWRPSGLDESTLTVAVAVTARTGPPTGGGTVTGVGFIPNDDSVIVTLPVLPAGARDWRVYPQGTMDFKYNEGGRKIEINGLPRTTPTTLVIDAIDKLGAFDFDERPKNHMIAMHVNGHGDPQNVPNVISSTTLVVQPAARSFIGTQALLDCFQTAPNFAPTVPDDRIRQIQGATFAANDLSNPWVREFTATNWIFREYIADAVRSRRFFGHTHEMDIQYDGGAWIGDPSPEHNNNTTTLYESRFSADLPSLASGNWLHMTFEVDAFSMDRRWCGFGCCEWGDIIVNPPIVKLTGTQAPTWTGNAFVWEINFDLHVPELFIGGSTVMSGGGNGTGTRYPLVNTGFTANALGPSIHGTVADRTVVRPDGLPFNGDATRIDLRHKYDVFLNANQYRLYEEGVLVLSGTLPVAIPWVKTKMWASHHVYHTSNARIDEIKYNQGCRFHTDHREYCEVRHWDNMGMRVTNGLNLL